MEYINSISSTSFTPQLANYFKQASNFKQIFDFQTMKFNVTTGTSIADIAAAKATIKDQYVTLFKKDLNATYDAMGGLGNSYLQGKSILSFENFRDAVNGLTNTLHNKLFSFMDVQ